MKVTVTADHIMAAIKEYSQQPLLHRKATECCPLHQVMRPHLLNEPFAVGSNTVHSLEFGSRTLYWFTPDLPPELYISTEWEYAFRRMAKGTKYEFEVTEED